jgi:hypothetical protein
MEVTAAADPNVCWGRLERLLGADLLGHGHSLLAFAKVRKMTGVTGLSTEP